MTDFYFPFFFNYPPYFTCESQSSRSHPALNQPTCMPINLVTLHSLQATTRQGDSGEAGGALDRAHSEVLQTEEGEMDLCYLSISRSAATHLSCCRELAVGVSQFIHPAGIHPQHRHV